MKLIPHIINPTAQAMTWAAHSPVYKRINYTAPITRRWWSDSDMNNRIAQMQVDDTFNQIMLLVGPTTQYVEVFNEVAQRQGLGLEQHADFLEAIVPKFHARGLKVIGFNFSVGNPGSSKFGERDDFQYLYNRKWCGVDVIGMHEYWGDHGLTPYTALRHRQLVSTVPSHPPIILTECGRDAVEGGGSGWKASKNPDGSDVTAGQYEAELANFAAELDKDAYVLWAAVFTAGPTYDWAAFDTDDLKIGTGMADTALTPESWAAALERIGALERRDGLITHALKDVAEGKYRGADGVAGLVVALQGGVDDVSGHVLPDVNP